MVGTGRENEEQGTIGLRPTTREGPSAGQGEGRYFIIRFPPFCSFTISNDSFCKALIIRFRLDVIVRVINLWVDVRTGPISLFPFRLHMFIL